MEELVLNDKSDINNCPELLNIFNDLKRCADLKITKETPLILSKSHVINIVDFGPCPDNQSAYGIMCLVVVGDIKGIDVTKSLLSNNVNFNDFGVSITRKINKNNGFSRYSLSHREFTFKLFRTCDCLRYFEVRCSKHAQYDAEITVGDHNILFSGCELEKSYDIMLNMLHETSVFNKIQLKLSFDNDVSLEDIEVYLGEIFLNNETRLSMHAEKLILK